VRILTAQKWKVMAGTFLTIAGLVTGRG
jgi:hypothetical protein